MPTQATIEQIRTAIEQAQRIAVVSHIRPDGDAVGSALGLVRCLRAANKQAQCIFADLPGEDLHFIVKDDRILSLPDNLIDLTIVVDCSELPRVGEALDLSGAPDINIDHHVTNTYFARLNYVNPQAAAAAEMLAELIPQLGLPVPPDAAEALLTGILTDTIGFRTSAVTANTLRLAAWLMEQGADLHSLYQAALLQRGVEALRYWSSGLAKIQFEDGLLWSVLSLADREQAGYLGRDDADLVNVLSGAKGAEVVVIFIEQVNGAVKISWRCQVGHDVAKVAMQFGGGGHTLAAGAEVVGNLIEVQQRVLNETRRLLA